MNASHPYLVIYVLFKTYEANPSIFRSDKTRTENVFNCFKNDRAYCRYRLKDFQTFGRLADILRHTFYVWPTGHFPDRIRQSNYHRKRFLKNIEIFGHVVR
jgi:hypothetical protein